MKKRRVCHQTENFSAPGMKFWFHMSWASAQESEQLETCGSAKKYVYVNNKHLRMTAVSDETPKGSFVC